MNQNIFFVTRGAMEFIRNWMPHALVDVIIHHSPCHDGHASAAIARRVCRPNVVLMGAHPSQPEKIDVEALAGKHVLLVDIAFDLLMMRTLAQTCAQVLVLDHHVTNQKRLAGFGPLNVQCFFEMDRAATSLVWEYAHGPDIPMPRALTYIALADVWKHKDVPDALHFVTAFERPTEWSRWDAHFEDRETDAIIARGAAVREYQVSVMRTMMEKVRRTQWRGYTVAMVNVPFPWISEIGDMMCEQDPTNTVAIIWNRCAGDAQYSVSLRTANPNGPNCEEFAREFEGGGHKHGAGLRMEAAPWMVFSDTGAWE